jgi:hypothetical protein
VLGRRELLHGWDQLEELCIKGGVAMRGDCWWRVEAEDWDNEQRDLASVLACNLRKLCTFTISGVGIGFSPLDRSPRCPHPPIGAVYPAATHDTLLSFLLTKRVSCDSLDERQGQAGGPLTCGWSGCL